MKMTLHMTVDKKNIINLETFRAKGAKVFTGRDRGKYVRETSKLDELAINNSEIDIIIPDNIYSINPSFFEELFLNVVTQFGKEEFIKRFHFTSLGNYNYEKPLNEAFDRILRIKTAID